MSQSIASDDLLTLISLHGPSSDEKNVADYLENQVVSLTNITTQRIGDNLIVVRGMPRVAVFAHTDTTGFTLGYRRELIRIGGPRPKNGDRLRSESGLTGEIQITGDNPPSWKLRRVRDSDGKKVIPESGSRWVYARKPRVKKGIVSAPYLDNRAGTFAALEALRRSPNIAVAFCAGEEQHGHGARVCAEWLYREKQITQALISDITWHTKDTPCGKGVAISLRDAYCPRQSFLDRVLTLAEQSGIPYQREVQSSGGSDGGHILRSSVPLDWVFVGAPEKNAHTAREELTLSDLEAMIALLTYLAEKL